MSEELETGSILSFNANFLSAGLLGASVPEGDGLSALKEKRLYEIERRIIRIEMAMRRAGVEVEMVEFPRT